MLMIMFQDVSSNELIEVNLEPDVELKGKRLQCLGMTFTAERLPSNQMALTISDDSGELAEEFSHGSHPYSLQLAATDLIMSFGDTQ